MTSPAAATLATLLIVASTGVAAQHSNNLAYLSPVAGHPELGETEPADAAVGRRQTRKLLQTPAWNGAASVNHVLFPQGVASGDPHATSVILWTRIAPPVAGTATLNYAVATDSAFTNVVAHGTATSSSGVDYTIKVEAVGLATNTKYYYQWRYVPPTALTTHDQYSAKGRTRTLPAATEDIPSARIAFFSCSNLPAAYFTIYRQIARFAEFNQIDYNIHTGNYIYEGRGAGAFALPERDQVARTHQPDKEATTLADYRTRYNQYNSDVDLKAMRASAPLIAVWDDHEFAKGAWSDGAESRQTEVSWILREVYARKAYYEHMPIRPATTTNQIYRSFDIGKLIKLWMLDTRVTGRSQPNATAANDPMRTILGATQKTWLKNQLRAANATHTWKFIGQQVLFSHRCDTPSADQWDGYRQDQKDILAHLSTNKISNTVILTGNMNSHWALDIPAHPCPNEAGYNYNPATGAGSVAVEFVSSSVTAGYGGPNVNRTTVENTEARIKAANPHIKYQEGGYKGFSILTVTQTHVRNTWIFEKSLWNKSSSQQIIGESWRVNVNSNHLIKA